MIFGPGSIPIHVPIGTRPVSRTVAAARKRRPPKLEATQMSKKTLTYGFVGVLALALVALGIKTAYAHCGKCITDAKYFAGSLDDSRMTLAAAATVAEVETKGRAVHATVQRADDGVNVEVHCLVDDSKIVAVVVNGQTGDVIGSGEVRDLEGHARL